MGEQGAYGLLRRLLFALPPETAHGAALAALRAAGTWPRLAPRRRDTEVLGLRFPNRVGVAAGLDKDAVAAAGLARLGFGFVEIGTVTPRPQQGNSQPRLFRLIEDRALINRMGFNSAGAAAVAANLGRARNRIDVPVGVNIGKNRTTPVDDATRDYAVCLTAVYDVADYLTVNLSSPNTPGLRDLQSATRAHALVAALIDVRDRLASDRGEAAKPILVKLGPDLAAVDLDETAQAVVAAGADGFVAVNTTVARPAALRSPRATQTGGLSGVPLLPMARDTVRRLRASVGPGPAIIGVGGVATGADVAAMLASGADLVQVYTALVYAGPALARRLTSAGARRESDA
ncbi:MAG: quinone-dependent dihydroorotate dehydrogenase [Gammaproteobacteria bacterium]|nr:quinone-dependent dihydroorotate dehydrogenase [Gammaproteobacteria bacterium]